jgi:hypothetical protein
MLLDKCYYNDQMKENELGGAGSRHGKEEESITDGKMGRKENIWKT